MDPKLCRLREFGLEKGIALRHFACRPGQNDRGEIEQPGKMPDQFGNYYSDSQEEKAAHTWPESYGPGIPRCKCSNGEYLIEAHGMVSDNAGAHHRHPSLAPGG
jgi:hypothetical protein